MMKRESQQQFQDRMYRDAIKQDIEGVSTHTKIMTGKDPRKTPMSNSSVEKANREYDYQNIREQKGSAAGSWVQEEKTLPGKKRSKPEPESGSSAITGK